MTPDLTLAKLAGPNWRVTSRAVRKQMLLRHRWSPDAEVKEMIAQLSQVSSRAKRRMRLLASLAAAVGLLVVGWHLLIVMIPLMISAIAAVMLMPIMRLGERLRLARKWPKATRLSVAVAASLLAVMAVLGVLGLATYALIGGVKTFTEAVPGLTEESRGAFEQVEVAYRARVPARIQEVLNPRLEEYRSALLDAGFSALERTAGILQSNIPQLIAIIATPVAIFQMLYQPRALTDALRQLAPGPMQQDLTEMGRLAGRTVVAYVRVQLFGALFVGGLIWFLYWSVGIKLALPLGLLAAFTELVPIIGATIFILVAIVAVALTDIQRLPLAVVFFVLVQVVQNSIVAPRLQGQALGLHPVIIVVVLAVFSVFFGILGALVAAPVAGAAFRVLQYARDEWNNA